MVGLPGAGKTTRARELARSHNALRLTPDEWHLDLFGSSLRADGKRDLLEARLITVALRMLRLDNKGVPAPPPGSPTWLAWAVDRWPTLTTDYY